MCGCRTRGTKNYYLRFKNELENFEVYKIGFCVGVTIATNICNGCSYDGNDGLRKKSNESIILKMYIKNELLMNSV